MSAAPCASIALNPQVADRVRVVEGDAAVADLPRGADVVLAEIIETGLLDEQQVPVLNALRRRGVITASTRLLPATYETTLELVDADHRYYGSRSRRRSTTSSVGPTHALNGDKILPIAPLRGVSRASLRWRYRMGAGLGALELACEPVTASTHGCGRLAR